MKKDLPYLEMLYRFVFGKKSYYDLEMTRYVEPQSKDKDERGAERIGGEGSHPLTRTAPQRGRKKQHWQVPPVTRVRVKKRIKRWDGFYVLCTCKNMNLC